MQYNVLQYKSRCIMDSKGSCPKLVEKQESQCTPNIYSALIFSFMIKIRAESNKISSYSERFMFPVLTSFRQWFAWSRVGFMGTPGLFSAAVFERAGAWLSMARSITQHLTWSATTENKQLHNGRAWLSVSEVHAHDTSGKFLRHVIT